MTTNELTELAELIVEKLAKPFSAEIGARFEPALKTSMFSAVSHTVDRDLVNKLTAKLVVKITPMMKQEFAKMQRKLEAQFAEQVLEYLKEVTKK